MARKISEMWKTESSNNSSDNDDGDRIERHNSRNFTISSLHCKLSPTRILKWPRCNCVQIMCNTLGAHRVQPVLCHVVQWDSFTVMFDTVEITFILALFY